jgi:antitoxin protein of toxin-antitoxin system
MGATPHRDPEGAHAMGFLDKLKSKATETVDKHGGKITQGLDKAGELVDKKTGGKHHDKIEKGKSSAKDALDKLDGKNDDIPDTKPPAGGTAPGGSTPGH